MIIHKNQKGSTLVVTLSVILVLAIIAANVFDSTNAGYQASFQSSSWDEALNAAESGVDYGMNTLNQLAASGSSAWAGWTVTTGTGSITTGTTVTTGTITTYTFNTSGTNTITPHLGLGNQKMYATVKIDNAISYNGQTWYRIRSTGTAEIPGLRRVSYEHSLLDINNVKNHKTMLRGLSYNTDLTNGYCHLPQVSRTVEVLAAPMAPSLFMDALAVQTSVQMSGGSYIDSFDSSIAGENVPATSNAASQHTAAWSKAGAVASDEPGNDSNLGNCDVYGNASSNGPGLSGTGGVTGTVYGNYSQVFPPVPTPPTPNKVNPGNETNINLGGNNTASLAGGANGATAIYEMNYINLSGQSVLNITNPNPGQTSYITIYLDGGGNPPGQTTLNTSGQAYFNQAPGVVLTIFVNGATTVSGSGFDNQGGLASDLTIYGIPPANNSNPQFTISGQGTFIGAVYAPAYKLNISGGANFDGAMVGYSATLSGGGGFHYDEALGASGGSGTLGFQMGSWIEDIRWQ